MAATAVVACAGGDGSDSSSGPTASPDPLAADAGSALTASADRLLDNVQSGAADFTWKIERDGFHIEGDGDYAFRSPDSLGLEAHYTGEGSVPAEFREKNDSEVRVVGETAYVKSPPLGEGWVSFTPEEFSTDWTVTQRLMLNHSPLDYDTVVGSVQVITGSGQETADGREYLRIDTQVDAGALMNALADAYGSQGQVMIANRFSGSVPFSVWLDPATLLPHRVLAEGEFRYLEAPTQLELSVTFAEVNSLSQAIEAPDDTTPFAELVAGG